MFDTVRPVTKGLKVLDTSREAEKKMTRLLTARL